MITQPVKRVEEEGGEVVLKWKLQRFLYISYEEKGQQVSFVHVYFYSKINFWFRWEREGIGSVDGAFNILPDTWWVYHGYS